jgi:hypothetical protein
MGVAELLELKVDMRLLLNKEIFQNTPLGKKVRTRSFSTVRSMLPHWTKAQPVQARTIPLLTM